jgi:hypothetical protein
LTTAQSETGYTHSRNRTDRKKKAKALCLALQGSCDYSRTYPSDSAGRIDSNIDDFRQIQDQAVVDDRKACGMVSAATNGNWDPVSSSKLDGAANV